MTFKKIASLALAVLMLCSVLCACGDAQNNGSTPANTKPSSSQNNTQPSGSEPTVPTTVPQDTNALYQVAVYDIYGKPATSGIAVKFLQNGEQVAMQIMNTEGVAAMELPKGDYTVELMFVGSNAKYYYDTTDLSLSATKTQLTIHLCLQQSTEGEVVYADGVEYTAYPLSTGNTYVTLQPGRNYFLYHPDEAGEYQFFTMGGTYKVGYYGGEHFIMQNDAGKAAPNNGTALSISSGMISPNNTFVIGVDNPTDGEVQATLCVLRASDYIDTSIHLAIYKATHKMTPWTMPENATVKKFNILGTQSYKLVLDETTGFYHLNTVDGPLVVVFLGANAASYLDYAAPFDTILKNTNVNAYFKDDTGKYTSGESYNSCLQSYIGVYNENMTDANGNVTGGYEGGCIDRESGLYPLTEDLMYIIQQHGIYAGWYDVNNANYLFQDTVVSEAIAWLFMCGYLE